MALSARGELAKWEGLSGYMDELMSLKGSFFNKLLTNLSKVPLFIVGI